MPGVGANETCRFYIAEEGGIIRNGMFDLAWGRAGSPLAVGFSLHEQVEVVPVTIAVVSMALGFSPCC